MGKKIVTVLGSTGAQGGGVVRALLDQQDWQVRAVTRNVRCQAALHLAELGCEIAEADLNSPLTLFEALQGSFGLFAVTNFWDRDTRMSEFKQGKNLVRAAKDARIQHFIWSTLPDYKALSGGKYRVPHFTSKARVDNEVKRAGFRYHTFVEAPFYFQNFLPSMRRKKLLMDVSCGVIQPIKISAASPVATSRSWAKLLPQRSINPIKSATAST